MPKKKPYTFFWCRDCDQDFAVSTERKRIYCPLCGEHFYVEKVKDVWMERPFNYKRPWTPEEDEIVIVGRKQGYSYQEISDSLLARTPQSVRRRLQELKKKEVMA
ncbi:hypothetical protein LRR81_08815 [Metabacillus sp. GX 13764]|uniref:SANT/Myb-like DNA-binding domain-containing protein n=1 Tax=Metabacillus kandeliae TaxID=2900151 RepID=UPI001E31F83F|nr:SANT/Myb-like DNA-binding domain-containing protein [Metabacillus kandeliae]MCD7034335.1 hypothetical protein [Metabacillus kandeliae]